MGGVITSDSLRSIDLLTLNTIEDKVLLSFEIICLLLVLFYTFEEIMDMVKERLSYITRFWNIIDISIIIVSMHSRLIVTLTDTTFSSQIAYAAFTFTIFRNHIISERLETFNNDPSKFINFDKLGHWQVLNKNFIGICAFLVWLKILKYLGFNKTMLQFSTTLARVE